MKAADYDAVKNLRRYGYTVFARYPDIMGTTAATGQGLL